MYPLQQHQPAFTQSIRLEVLPSYFQNIVRNWSMQDEPEARLHYSDGEYFTVVPFELLTKDPISRSELQAFVLRFNRLTEGRSADLLDQHIVSYPYKGWSSVCSSLEEYLEILLLLQHLKVNISPECVAPNTFAVYVHE